MEVSKLNGKNVITSDAFSVGQVTEAIMNDQWNITHLKIDLTKEATKEIGFKKPIIGHITICLPIDIVQGLGDVITLSSTRDELRMFSKCEES